MTWLHSEASHLTLVGSAVVVDHYRPFEKRSRLDRFVTIFASFESIAAVISVAMATILISSYAPQI